MKIFGRQNKKQLEHGVRYDIILMKKRTDVLKIAASDSERRSRIGRITGEPGIYSYRS